MALMAKERGGAEIEPVPAGVHVATCFGLVDLGIHANAVFGGEQHKILVQWELPEVRAEFERDGAKVNQPRAISKRYTLSLSEKANLRRDLESWRGRKFTAPELAGFDLRALLGATCQLQIVHETSKENRTYATIAAIMALPKGTPKPKPENPHSFFSFEEAGDKLVMPVGLPEWITKIIMESREWRERGATKTTPPIAPVPGPATASTETQGAEDDVPF